MRLGALCTDLRSYIEKNKGTLIDYGQRYRDGKPISSSRAESTVNHLVNARINKRRQMRWSPQGAHRVLQVRAAVLDERLGPRTNQAERVAHAAAVELDRQHIRHQRQQGRVTAGSAAAPIVNSNPPPSPPQRLRITATLDPISAA